MLWWGDHAANAAIVPQMAIIMPANNIRPSPIDNRPTKAAFAVMGPITQRINAEKEPRNAINVLKSGNSIETATDRHAKTVRSKIVNMSFSIYVLFDSTTVRSFETPGRSCSNPSIISSVILTLNKPSSIAWNFRKQMKLTGRDVSANFVLT